MKGGSNQTPDTQLLSTFANHAALAIEYAQLRQQAVQTHLLEETDRWRRALLSSVSHDLRTPLASIKAAASGLSDSSLYLDPIQKEELLETISAETDRLSRLVVNLLDMTRIEAGVLTPHSTVIEIAELVDEGINAIGGEKAKTQIVVKNDSHELFVAADHVLISQVIANLLDNALRHSPDGKPVTIEILRNEAEVAITVSDHGPGVPPELMDRIFEMFRKDSDDSHTGIGLAIAKSFIEAHGGNITVANSPSGGAGFRFTLPLVYLDEGGYLDDDNPTD